MNKNDYKEWLKYFVAMYQCIYINIFSLQTSLIHAINFAFEN